MARLPGSLLLVVDADILRAAGETAGPARKTRDVLEAIRKICHCVLLSKEALAEWDKHASRFSRTWWTAMTSRGKIRRVELQLMQHDETLEKVFADGSLAPERLPNLKKDIHLFAAALDHGDGIVISNDRRAAKGFADLSGLDPVYAKVKWWGSDRAICAFGNLSGRHERRASSPA